MPYHVSGQQTRHEQEMIVDSRKDQRLLVKQFAHATLANYGNPTTLAQALCNAAFKACSLGRFVDTLAADMHGAMSRCSICAPRTLQTVQGATRVRLRRPFPFGVGSKDISQDLHLVCTPCISS